MKWFSFILSLYILSLALITCTDAQPVQFSSENHDMVVATDSHAGHDHSTTSGAMDECSPLCTCHCCHIHVTLTDITQNNAPLGDLSATPSYHNQFKDIAYFDFFIPPRA